MRRLIPNFSDLFAAWASAGQYSSVEELELDSDVLHSNNVRTFPGQVKAQPAGLDKRVKVAAQQTKTRWG